MKTTPKTIVVFVYLPWSRLCPSMELILPVKEMPKNTNHETLDSESFCTRMEIDFELVILQWLSSNWFTLSFAFEFASKNDFSFTLFGNFFKFAFDDSAASSPWIRILYLVYVCCIVLGQQLGLESLYINAWRFDLILHWKLSNFAKNPIFLHM